MMRPGMCPLIKPDPSRRHCQYTLMFIRFEPLPMRGLLRPVPTYCHATPSPPPASRMIGEKERASWSLTGFHTRKIFRADKLRQGFSDRKEKRLRRTPPAHHLKRQARRLGLVLYHDPAEPFVALQQAVQRLQLAQAFQRQRTAFVLLYEAPEPFTQVSCLIRDLVQLTGKCPRPNSLERASGQFADDVAALNRTLERVTGPVVLAGHAYAGAVIAATRDEKVTALVYVAGLARSYASSIPVISRWRRMLRRSRQRSAISFADFATRYPLRDVAAWVPAPLAHASTLTQSDGAGRRLSLPKISLADFVQTKGLG